MSQSESLHRSQHYGEQSINSASRSAGAGQNDDQKSPATDTTADIAHRIGIALASASIYGLMVSVKPDGVARIEGAVRNEQDYASAERLARVPGVRRVLNHLIVDPLVGSETVDRSVLSPEVAAQI